MTGICNRCKTRTVRTCYLGDARDNAEFLGMCDPCYTEWIAGFPAYQDSP